MNTTRIRGAIFGLAAAVATLAAAPGASATISSVPNGAGGTISCDVQVGGDLGERHCSGIFTTFDGAPIDVNIGFPAEPIPGPDGAFPVVGLFHGWGGSKVSLTSSGMQQWLDDGYAVFSMSDRGWGLSCGGTDPKRLQPVCAEGYNHLMDTRFEVRDAQEVFEELADQAATGATGGEGLIDPQRIGATGGSYGGGLSMSLAALKNRQMLPDGSLVPWVSEGGKQMTIAAAQPDIPWTDLAYSLQPNGHTLDYVADAPYTQRGRIGVLKQSFTAGLFGTGLATSNYAPPGTDPDADLIQWYALVNAGEPYDQSPLAGDVVDELTTHHSSYYIDDSVAPAPLLISNGWTDDLFPPDEALRFYNRTRTEHPGTPISLIFSDHGHQRGQNKAVDAAFRNGELHAWFDHFVKGSAGPPTQGVRTLTQTCPDSTPSVGPFSASTWAEMAPGEVRLTDAAAKTVAPGGGNPLSGQRYDPIGGSGACATAPSADAPGAASYRQEVTTPFTMMGSPTIVADINSPGPNSQVSARLLDVPPGGGEATLVARGLYRPEINVGTAPTRQVFQLHPNGWRFETGHELKLELLPNDVPYGRVSNGQLPYTVSNLELRVPVRETGSPFLAPADKVLPAGYQLAADYAGDPTVPVGGDSDRDGIPDSQDLCPQQAGPVSNSGCPATVTPGTPGTTTKCKKRKKKGAKRAAKKKRKRCKGKRKKKR